MIIGLSIILLLVLTLPFTKFVERNLEIFLFIMSIAAVLVSQTLSWHLVEEALVHPINITLAVLIAGLIFKWFQNPFEKGIRWISNAMPFRLFIALFVVLIGLLSSMITAIIAAIILVSVISVLKLDRQSEIRIVILACFAIGMGAALTPLGEPLSTIVVNKLDEEFFYLFDLIGMSIIPMVILFGILAAFSVKKVQQNNPAKNEVAATSEASFVMSEAEAEENQQGLENKGSESYKEIAFRSLKIYLFVMALTFLGAGFEPFINAYLLDLNPKILYWINMVSAVLDNATLAAAEISPAMNDETIKDILMGLLISGGMLIPGNIPNIIAAGKLKITSVEYARFAFPIGLATMVIYFLFILF